MLVVRVEIWPGGIEADAFEIGRMEIINESGLSAVSDYSAHVIQRECSRLKVAAADRRIHVRAHARRDGPWKLIQKVLDHFSLSERRFSANSPQTGDAYLDR